MEASAGKTNVLSVVNAPKSVHPTAIRNHGLFGLQFVRQHMIVDDHWTPSSLTEQFKGMADLLSKRQIFKGLEKTANRKRIALENRNLKRQCRDGRTKLQMSLHGENTKRIRNFLINHKDMQRLYQKMPIHMVVDNINQRTFVMRKERDRLRARLDQMKKVYETKLLERAILENRIKYENEFVLEEDVKSREFRKKIENSNVRLKAIKTINGTYKKMIQILRHDSIFYEPILRSLSKDIEDQATFIKHILYLGMPAIAKFKELSEEYKVMENKSRKNLQAKLQWVNTFKKNALRRISQNTPKQQAVLEEEPTSKLNRYVRETASMMFLKNELESIESVIKQVKFATLCSQAKEIYPRMKAQVDNNEKLNKMIELDLLGHQHLETKQKLAEFQQGSSVHNLTVYEYVRQKRIKLLQDQIAEEDKFETKTINHMKRSGKAYVMLRVTIWNLLEILRHVDRVPRGIRKTYPNSYLKLPLLKFEQLTMRAVPPEVYEENIDSLMHSIKRKVTKLMKVYKADAKKEDVMKYKEEYHDLFLDSMDAEDMAEGGDGGQQAEEEEEPIDVKTTQNVPSRKQIKFQSAKLVEELSKKDD